MSDEHAPATIPLGPRNGRLDGNRLLDDLPIVEHTGPYTYVNRAPFPKLSFRAASAEEMTTSTVFDEDYDR